MNYIKKNFEYFVIATVFIISFSSVFDSKLDLNGDNFNYLMLSKSLAEGNGYVSTIMGDKLPVNFYPPGYPAILAVFRLLFGDNVIIFKIINGLFLLISILLLFNIGKAIVNRKSVFFSASILLLLNYHIMRFSTMVMSEMSFLLFSTLSFFFLYKLPEDDKYLKSPYFYFLVGSISLAYYIRAIGIVVFLAVVLHYLIRKQWKLSVCLTSGFILLYLPWSIRNSIYGIKSRYMGTVTTVNPWRPEEGHITTIREFISKVIFNFDETVIKGFVDAIFPFMKIDYSNNSTIQFVVFSLIIFGIVLLGALKMGRLKYLFVLYILGNISVLMIWHGGNQIRYIIPIIPVICITFYNGISWIGNKFIKNEKVISGFGYFIIITGLFSIPLMKELATINSQHYYPPSYKNYINIAKAIKDNTPQNTIICGRKPEILYYFANRPSCNYKYSLNPDEVIHDLMAKKIDYVILDQLGYNSTEKYLLPAIRANPNLFKVIIHLKNPDTILFQFKRSSYSLNNSQKQRKAHGNRR